MVNSPTLIIETRRIHFASLAASMLTFTQARDCQHKWVPSIMYRVCPDLPKVSSLLFLLIIGAHLRCYIVFYDVLMPHYSFASSLSLEY